MPSAEDFRHYFFSGGAHGRRFEATEAYCIVTLRKPKIENAAEEAFSQI